MAIRVPLLCVPSHLLAARGEDRGPLFFAPEILFKEFLESEVPAVLPVGPPTGVAMRNLSAQASVALSTIHFQDFSRWLL